jgi:hypothetical protein
VKTRRKRKLSILAVMIYPSIYFSKLFRFALVLTVMVQCSSCNSYRYFILGKKYVYYRDYSDSKKRSYYAANKNTIDSLVILSSAKPVHDYLAFKSRFYPNYPATVGTDTIFFDTSSNFKNVVWVDYLKTNPLEAAQMENHMRQIRAVAGRLHPMFKGQLHKSVDIAEGSVYIPLKRIAEDIYAGGDTYSFIIAFDTGKTNKDSIQPRFREFESLRVLDASLLTNGNVKKY